MAGDTSYRTVVIESNVSMLHQLSEINAIVYKLDKLICDRVLNELYF